MIVRALWAQFAISIICWGIICFLCSLIPGSEDRDVFMIMGAGLSSIPSIFVGSACPWTEPHLDHDLMGLMWFIPTAAGIMAAPGIDASGSSSLFLIISAATVGIILILILMAKVQIIPAIQE